MKRIPYLFLLTTLLFGSLEIYAHCSIATCNNFFLSHGLRLKFCIGCSGGSNGIYKQDSTSPCLLIIQHLNSIYMLRRVEMIGAEQPF